MVNMDIRTRVELSNETRHEVSKPGNAGSVALIGAFPSDDTNVFAAQNLSQVISNYNIDEGTNDYRDYDGSRASTRIFMNGINGYVGASRLTTVNICDYYEASNTITVEDDGDSNGTVTDDEQIKIDAARLLTYDKLNDALHKIADEDMDLLFISSDLRDVTKDGEHSLADAWNLVLNFVDNEFTSHRPVNVIAAAQSERTDANTLGGQDTSGIPSQKINVLGAESSDGKTITTYGAKQISQLFKRENNELCTAGLFYQGGKINDESVDAMEMAAHMCGWIASTPVDQDLTYQTIPGVTAIDEEAYFGPHDAGTLINQYGINVIKPKDRLQKTFYVNNSITPSGWHTNHVRSVTYLLKQYAFEAGLGVNNFTNNIEIFRSNLETVTRDVMDTVSVIRDVTIGDIEVLNDYNIYVPLDIILAGVITKINVGVSMELDESGQIETTLTTSS